MTKADLVAEVAHVMDLDKDLLTLQKKLRDLEQLIEGEDTRDD